MNAIINQKRLKLYWLVAVLWLLLWGVHSFLIHQRTVIVHCINELWLLVYLASVNYLFFEYSLPAIRKKRGPVAYNIAIGLLLAAAHLLLTSFGLYGWAEVGNLLGIYTPLRYSILNPDSFFNRLTDSAIYHGETGIASTIFFGIALILYRNYQLKQTTQQLRLEKQEAELNYLKSQTNPHFLFNTLNNIYSLANERSELTAEAVLRLSQMLRFMLYETGGEYIAIEQEVRIIHDFIALEKLRYDKTLSVDFRCELEDMKQAVPPLLLMPLVENAFKHGVSETLGQPFVSISLLVHNSKLSFHVRNSYGPTMETEGKQSIGLPNLRRQLELLYSDFSLSVHKADSVFSTTLEINLGSHA
jgi:two-component system LytT family sensor kinase